MKTILNMKINKLKKLIKEEIQKLHEQDNNLPDGLMLLQGLHSCNTIPNDDTACGLEWNNGGPEQQGFIFPQGYVGQSTYIGSNCAFLESSNGTLITQENWTEYLSSLSFNSYAVVSYQGELHKIAFYSATVAYGATFFADYNTYWGANTSISCDPTTAPTLTLVNGAGPAYSDNVENSCGLCPTSNWPQLHCVQNATVTPNGNTFPDCEAFIDQEGFDTYFEQNPDAYLTPGMPVYSWDVEDQVACNTACVPYEEPEEEEDICAGLEGYANSLGIEGGIPGVDNTTMTAADQYCIKCQAGSWPDDMAEMCSCCDTNYTYDDNITTFDPDYEGLPSLPSKDKAPFKEKPKKQIEPFKEKPKKELRENFIRRFQKLAGIKPEKK